MAISALIVFNATPLPTLVPSVRLHYTTTPPLLSSPNSLSLTNSIRRSSSCSIFAINGEGNAKFSGSGGCGGGQSNNGGGSGGYRGGGDGNDWDKDMKKRKNRDEALMALIEAGTTLESLPKDLKAAILEGRIPGSVMGKYLDLEKSNFSSWLMKSGGFEQRLWADDLFLAGVATEFGGVGIFTKTAAEYESRRENFFKEIEIVIADVVMSIIAEFMLACFPAPTVSLRAPLALNAGHFANCIPVCPYNASPIALCGSSFSFLQRIGAKVGNVAKLFAFSAISSLVGTVVANALINAHKTVDHSAGYGLGNVPVQSTGVAYGACMVIYSNLRHQVSAGVIKQWFLDPILNRCDLFLSAFCFAVRTGHPFPGSSLYQALSGVIKQRLLKPLLHQHKLFFGAICFTVGTGHPFLGAILWWFLTLVL